MGAEAEAEGTDFPRRKMFCFHKKKKESPLLWQVKERSGDPTAERLMPPNRETLPEFPTRSRLLITRGTHAEAGAALFRSIPWAGAGIAVLTERGLAFIVAAPGDSGAAVGVTLYSQLLFHLPLTYPCSDT